MKNGRVIVVGGGIIGLASAYKLLKKNPGMKVTVLEKEEGVGRHQSGHNSGVLHAGLYYKPGSSKAKLAVSGIRQMTRFCEEQGIPHEICGKIVVAVTQDEVPRLRDLFERGTANGLQGLEWLTGDGLREIEPHAAGVAAVRVPEEGITDYPRVCLALVTRIREMGGEVKTRSEVKKLERKGFAWTVETTSGEWEGDALLNCAGLYCDRIARMAGFKVALQIVPFRGEYYKLRDDRAHLVRNLIYPVPDPNFPFLGVHFTRMIGGGVEAGPNAVLALSREGYRHGQFSVKDLAGSLTFSGLWRFLVKHPRESWNEVRRSYSKKLFGAALRRLVPELRTEDLEGGTAGVRAQAMFPNGELVQDFVFASGPGQLHVLNAPSPGATASLAIADEIVPRLQGTLE
ncbi:MAG: L-2-hydroxyglutarate oxidase [Gemmatimonadaceae bacterium]